MFITLDLVEKSCSYVIRAARARCTSTKPVFPFRCRATSKITLRPAMSRPRRHSVGVLSADPQTRRNAQKSASRARKREALERKLADLEEALASQRETLRLYRREIAELQAIVAKLSGGEVSAASDAPSVSASDDTDAMPSSASLSVELTDDDEWKPPADEGPCSSEQETSNSHNPQWTC